MCPAWKVSSVLHDFCGEHRGELRASGILKAEDFLMDGRPEGGNSADGTGDSLLNGSPIVVLVRDLKCIACLVA